MRKSRKFGSMPIISLNEGVQIGSVKNLIVDPGKMEIAAIFIEQRGWFREQKIIPYSKVRSIGNDAITIDQSESVHRSFNLPEILKLIKEKADPIGVKVITEDGTVLGAVDEYYVDENTGKIVSLEISGKFLESLFKGRALLSTKYVRTMGNDIIVVSKEAEQGLEKVDGGLQETISSLKEGTSTFFESTLHKTKTLSKNIKQKYDKQMKHLNNLHNQHDTDSKQMNDNVTYSTNNDPNYSVTSKVEINDEDVLPEINAPKTVNDADKIPAPEKVEEAPLTKDEKEKEDN